MKTKLFFLALSCIFYMSSYGQLDCLDDLVTLEIDDSVNGPCSIVAVDLNGDNFNDLLFASWTDNTVAWWENDGSGNFIEKHIITSTALEACSAVANDVDGDGDNDVVASYIVDDTIALWRNDGEGNFTEELITTTADGAGALVLAEINDDDHIDIVCGYYEADTIAWWENDGFGNFGPERIITTETDRVRSIVAVDLDNDGDNDVLSASVGDGKIACYENVDGMGTFGMQQILIQDPAGAWRVSAGDINDDDYEDVVASIGNSELSWLENEDGSWNFIRHLVSDTSVADWTIPLDIDEDGDMDIISAEWQANKIVYFKNIDGLGTIFEETLLIQPGGWQNPVGIDIAEIDYFTSCSNDIVSIWDSGHIGHHTDLLGIDDNTLKDFSVYPIPTSGILHIQSNATIVQIEVYNLMGQLILSNTEEDQIDVSHIGQGIYFIKVMDENGDFGTKRVVKM